MNITLTIVVHGVTPKKKFTRRKLELSPIKVFGCIAYVNIPHEKRNKLNPKAKMCLHWLLLEKVTHVITPQLDR